MFKVLRKLLKGPHTPSHCTNRPEEGVSHDTRDMVWVFNLYGDSDTADVFSYFIDKEGHWWRVLDYGYGIKSMYRVTEQQVRNAYWRVFGEKIDEKLEGALANV